MLNISSEYTNAKLCLFGIDLYLAIFAPPFVEQWIWGKIPNAVRSLFAKESLQMLFQVRDLPPVKGKTIMLLEYLLFLWPRTTDSSRQNVSCIYTPSWCYWGWHARVDGQCWDDMREGRERIGQWWLHSGSNEMWRQKCITMLMQTLLLPILLFSTKWLRHSA